MATKPGKSGKGGKGKNGKGGKGGKGKAGKTAPAAPAAAAPAPAPAPAAAPTVTATAPAPAPVAAAPAPAPAEKSALETKLDRIMGDMTSRKVPNSLLESVGINKSLLHPLNNRIGRYKMSRGSVIDDFTISVVE